MTTSSHTIRIQGMNCASCVGRVEAALAALDGIDGVSVNLATETARVTADDPRMLKRAAETLEQAGYPPRTARVTLTIGSMSCASCVGRVEAALRAVPGVLEVSVNLATEQAILSVLEGVTAPDAIAAASTAAGYPARVASAAGSARPVDSRDEEARHLARRVVLAAVLALPVFLLEMGAHVIPGAHMLIHRTIGHEASWLIQFALTTIILFGPGLSFFTKGLPALLRAAPDMNSLVAVGTGAAWSYSVVATFLPGLLPDGVRAVYFESAAVIVVLILLGRWMEARAKGRTGAAIRALVALRPPTARVLRNGQSVEVPADSLAVGDLFLLRPGDRVPTDGTVTDGAGSVDESMISGEAVPVHKLPGDPVTGGTVNGTGSLTVRASRVGSDTVLAQIIRMVEEAQGARLPIQGMVNRVTLWFVPVVMVLAALTVAVWLAIGPDPALTHALVAGVSVLIIACPCAMGLATPTSIMVGTGRAAELGVLFRKGDALQALSDVDVVALDKTGTVTMGHPVLADIASAPGIDPKALLTAAAALEVKSEHPLAGALVTAAGPGPLPAVSAFKADPGYGVSGLVDGRRVTVGAGRMMARDGIDADAFQQIATDHAARGRTVIFVAMDGRVAGVIAVSDPVKPHSAAAIAALKARGLRVVMISGDKEATARAIAAETGIDEVIADVLPDGKVAALDALRRDGSRVAFVGDGINDAPALAHADVGIAIGTGTDVAISSADVVLMSGDLRGVVNAVQLSTRTMANIRQNLVWAFGYNAALIPVAAGVLYPAFGLLLSPVFAAGAMALSSVSVLTNALRLRRVRPVLDEGVARTPPPPVASTPKNEVRA